MPVTRVVEIAKVDHHGPIQMPDHQQGRRRPRGRGLLSQSSCGSPRQLDESRQVATTSRGRDGEDFWSPTTTGQGPSLSGLCDVAARLAECGRMSRLASAGVSNGGCRGGPRATALQSAAQKQHQESKPGSGARQGGTRLAGADRSGSWPDVAIIAEGKARPCSRQRRALGDAAMQMQKRQTTIYRHEHVCANVVVWRAWRRRRGKTMASGCAGRRCDDS